MFEGKVPTLEEVEITHMSVVLKHFNGNMTHAAKALGIDRRTLYRKAEQYPTAFAPYVRRKKP